jgi:hypothetical protein
MCLTVRRWVNASIGERTVPQPVNPRRADSKARVNGTVNFMSGHPRVVSSQAAPNHQCD